jgi:hypothetical protein
MATNPLFDVIRRLKVTKGGKGGKAVMAKYYPPFELVSVQDYVGPTGAPVYRRAIKDVRGTTVLLEDLVDLLNRQEK